MEERKEIGNKATPKEETKEERKIVCALAREKSCKAMYVGIR